MTEDVLTQLLAGNREHVASLPATYFDEVQAAQYPPVVSVCCADSRVSQEGMWHVEEPGWLFTPSNIGNQAWTVIDGERVVDGTLLYPVTHAGTRTVVVVGHTGCGAVTAAYEVVAGDADEQPVGIAALVDGLVPVVEDGLVDKRVDADAPDEAVIDQLVEYNVHRQVTFLQEADDVPGDTAIHGFVYDFHGAYDDTLGRTYLVNRDGETDPEAIAASVPAEYRDAVGTLLNESRDGDATEREP